MSPNDSLRLLEQMISTPSASRQEDKTADLIEAFLHDQGVDARRHHNNVFALCKTYDPQKPTLLLNSHHDTVKPSPAYTRDPFTPIHEDGRLYGLGSNDAGASVVTLTAAFCNHYETPLPFNTALLIGAEEEVSGENGMRAMVPYFREHAIKIDCALVGEPTGLEAAIGERGLVVLDCVAHGVQGHAARDTGDNAIYHAINGINTLRGFCFPMKSAILGDIHMATTVINAGTLHNVIPDTCRFTVDIRTTDAYTNKEVVDMLREALAKASIEDGAPMPTEVTPRSTRIHASVIAPEHPLVRAAVKLGSHTFVSPTTSDRALMPWPALKLGPGLSERSHTADEYVLEQEVVDGHAFYNHFIDELTKSFN